MVGLCEAPLPDMNTNGRPLSRWFVGGGTVSAMGGGGRVRRPASTARPPGESSRPRKGKATCAMRVWTPAERRVLHQRPQ